VPRPNENSLQIPVEGAVFKFNGNSKWLLLLGSAIAISTLVTIFFFSLHDDQVKHEYAHIQKEVDLKCQSIQVEIIELKRSVDRVTTKVDKIYDKITK